MLKATMERPQGAGKHTYLRDFMVLEEGETLSSVRNPQKRGEALALLDRLKAEYDRHGLSTRFNVIANKLYQLLLTHFLPTRPPEEREMVEEIGRLLRYEGTVDLETCYNSTFCVHIIRKALKDYKLPMIRAKLWKPFATVYTGLVLAA